MTTYVISDPKRRKDKNDSGTESGELSEDDQSYRTLRRRAGESIDESK